MPRAPIGAEYLHKGRVLQAGLVEVGIETPEGHEIEVVENNSEKSVLVIPE